MESFRLPCSAKASLTTSQAKDPPTMVRDDFLNVFLMKQGGQLLRSEMAFQKPGAFDHPETRVWPRIFVRWVSRERDGPVALREVEPGRVGADDPPLHRARRRAQIARTGVFRYKSKPQALKRGLSSELCGATKRRALPVLHAETFC